jgi:Ca2+-transporting ATPase
MRLMQQPIPQPAHSVSAPQDGKPPKWACVEIVHSAVAGRVRFRHRNLVARAPLARKTETALRGTVGITSAHANPLTGSVLITYAAPASCQRLAEIIEDVVAGRIPGEADGAPPPRGLSSAAVPALMPSIPRQWHALTRSMVSEQLATDTEAGLVAEEAKRRLFTHGRNELVRLEPRSMAALLAEQMTSLPITLLGGSAVLSLATGGMADAVIIAAVVLLNAGIATATERQAEHTILGLSRYAPSPVPVVRGGRRDLVQPSELVPGDRILLERGTHGAAHQCRQPL